MNLKFIEDMYKTYTNMKSAVYILAWLAGIHTVTFTFYVLYKHYNEDKKNGVDQLEDEISIRDTKGVNENTENTISTLQMQYIDENVDVEENIDVDVDEIVDEKINLYNNLLSKNTELDKLIIHLDDIQNNIIIIREKLEDLNNKPFVT